MQVPPEALADVTVSLYLEKHGAYYHPIRVVAQKADQVVPFVLNGAVTGHGLALIEKENGIAGYFGSRTWYECRSRGVCHGKNKLCCG